MVFSGLFFGLHSFLHWCGYLFRNTAGYLHGSSHICFNVDDLRRSNPSFETLVGRQKGGLQDIPTSFKEDLKKKLGTNFYKIALHTKGGILLHPGKLVRAMVDALPENVKLYENSMGKNKTNSLFHFQQMPTELLHLHARCKHHLSSVSLDLWRHTRQAGCAKHKSFKLSSRHLFRKM